MMIPHPPRHAEVAFHPGEGGEPLRAFVISPPDHSSPHPWLEVIKPNGDHVQRRGVKHASHAKAMEDRWTHV